MGNVRLTGTSIGKRLRIYFSQKNMISEVLDICAQREDSERFGGGKYELPGMITLRDREVGNPSSSPAPIRILR